MVRHIAAENILERLSDIHNYPEGSFAPYEEFLIRGKAYYFTPDGFLYRKEDPAAEEVGTSSAATSPTKSGTTDRTRATKALSKRGGPDLQVVCEGSTPHSFLSSQEALSVSIWAIEIRPI